MTPQTMAHLHAKAFSATRAWTAQEFSNLLAHAETFAIGDAQSFVLIRKVADEAEVLTLATHPAQRRKGLARDRLHEAEALAAANGATKVFLEVAEDNHAAIALYAAFGYRQIGRRPGYYLPKDGAPVAALVLRKALVTT